MRPARVTRRAVPGPAFSCLQRDQRSSVESLAIAKPASRSCASRGQLERVRAASTVRCTDPLQLHVKSSQVKSQSSSTLRHRALGRGGGELCACGRAMRLGGSSAPREAPRSRRSRDARGKARVGWDAPLRPTCVPSGWLESAGRALSIVIVFQIYVHHRVRL